MPSKHNEDHRIQLLDYDLIWEQTLLKLTFKSNTTTF